MKSDVQADTEALFAAEAPAESPEVVPSRLLESASPIVARLDKLAADAVSKRADIERRWIEDLRQFHGQRDVRSDDAKKSSVFVNITRPKTNRVEGRICDLLFPPDDQNWGIQPTPVPALATIAQKGMEEANRAAEELNRMQAAASAPGPAPGAAPPDPAAFGATLQKAADLGTQAVQAQKILSEAEARAGRMADEIRDQLMECGFARKSRDAISWACKLGVGILKGPVITDRSRGAWVRGPDGAYRLGAAASNGPGAPPAQPSPRPSVECVSPWSFFPDPSASDMADCEYVLERHLPNRQELKKLARQLDFDAGAVKALLEAGPGQGADSDLSYLSEIRSLTGENTAVTGRYVLWEYHGPLEVQETAALIRALGGAEADARAATYEADHDPLESRMVIIWFCEGQALKIAEHYPMDSGDHLYSVFSIEKGGASILGAIGIPRMMRDSQAALNGAWRMMIDNAALSVGPQILMDKAAVKPVNGDWAMAPNKLWEWDTQNGGQTPFQTFNVPMNQEQLAGIIQLALTFIDDETAMPRIAEGGGHAEMQPGNTPVGTMSMLMNSAGINIRRIVKSWDDDITAGLITRIYDWNMQHSAKDEIKGDMSVEARGTSVLLVREMQAQNLSVLVSQWTVHPVLGAMVKPYSMAAMTLRALSLSPNDALVTEDEYRKKVEALAQAAAAPAEGAGATGGGDGAKAQALALQREIAMMEQQTKLQLSRDAHEMAVMELASREKQSIDQINASLEKERMRHASAERKLAVEVAVEEQAKREAAAAGRVPRGSGGTISLGTGPAESAAVLVPVADRSI